MERSFIAGKLPCRLSVGIRRSFRRGRRCKERG
jgi:hypothetical protein